jgi:hypothetical protein
MRRAGFEEMCTKLNMFSGNLAVLMALAAVLLQASCAFGLPFQISDTAAPVPHSGCHDPVPATPNQQQCCSVKHTSQALLPSLPSPDSLVVLDSVVSDVSFSLDHSEQQAPKHLDSSGPPPLIIFRI